MQVIVVHKYSPFILEHVQAEHMPSGNGAYLSEILLQLIAAASLRAFIVFRRDKRADFY